MSASETRSITTLLHCTYKVHDSNLLGFSPGDIEILGWCPTGPVLPYGASLVLLGHPSSEACFLLT